MSEKVMNEILKKRINNIPYRITRIGNGANDAYNEGARYGAEYILSHQWISVEEALPKCSEMVFVKDKYGNYDTAYLSKKGYWIANDGKEVIVSFWLPIPKFELNKPE